MNTMFLFHYYCFFCDAIRLKFIFTFIKLRSMIINSFEFLNRWNLKVRGNHFFGIMYIIPGVNPFKGRATQWS